MPRYSLFASCNDYSNLHELTNALRSTYLQKNLESSQLVFARVLIIVL